MRGNARRDLRDRALAFVAKRPGCTSTEAAAYLGCGRSSALSTLQWLRKQGTIEARGSRAQSGWYPTGGAISPPPKQRINGTQAAAIRRAWLLRQPVALDDGWVAALSGAGGDLTTDEWATRIGCAPVEVERACAWLDLRTKEAA